MSNCNHLLGYVHTYDRPQWIRAMDAAAELKAIAVSARAVRKQMAELKIMGTPRRVKDTIEAADYLDRRQCMAHWFNYCTDCGVILKPIFKQLKAQLSQ